MCYVTFTGPLHYLYVIYQWGDQNSTKLEKSFYWVHDTAVSAVLVQYFVSHFLCWIYSDRWLSINSEILMYYKIRSLSLTIQNIPLCYTTCLDATLHRWGSNMYHTFCDNQIICLTTSCATLCTVNCCNVSTHSRRSKVFHCQHAGSFLFPSPCLMYCNTFCKCKTLTSIHCTSFIHTLLTVQFEYNRGH
jgi:hypothetical protein